MVAFVIVNVPPPARAATWALLLKTVFVSVAAPPPAGRNRAKEAPSKDRSLTVRLPLAMTVKTVLFPPKMVRLDAPGPMILRGRSMYGKLLDKRMLAGPSKSRSKVIVAQSGLLIAKRRAPPPLLSGLVPTQVAARATPLPQPGSSPATASNSATITTSTRRPP